MRDVPLEFPKSWGLTIMEPVADTGLAKVWKVKTSDGTEAALKLYRKPDRGNEAPGAQLLARWQDRGAVRILAETENAVLMEWLEGPSLGDIARRGDPDKACNLLAEAAGRLHAKPLVDRAGLKDLNEVFAPLFDCTFSTSCRDGLRHDMTRAMSLAQSLLETQDNLGPLHGDLHHDNVIQTSHGLRVIDAKGYLGDPAFELANALRHPMGMPNLVRQPDQMDHCIVLYSQASKVPPKRLTQWAAAKCALSIFWRSKGTIAQDKEADLLNLFLRAADQ
ncbi:aminoglycoside phosphotransferase family protein [Ruegeria sp. Ofav3-42]|uniref:aminoglycoside phosphotransferase family protein n=1 Tax=Ruegeria sp. Ofav3-42 TaxID=2917759 RepID=UPI001EF424A0|nr:aminoglycoside phosphotransferase family protein [Ruegeria sp. Ofav3-42]MCG7521225.1 phosphotransferase [Ruegeria sp. Ofav3-42]